MHFLIAEIFSPSGRRPPYPSRVCCTCCVSRTPFLGEVSGGHSRDTVRGLGTFTSSPEGRADLGLADSGARGHLSRIWESSVIPELLGAWMPRDRDAVDSAGPMVCLANTGIYPRPPCPHLPGRELACARCLGFAQNTHLETLTAQIEKKFRKGRQVAGSPGGPRAFSLTRNLRGDGTLSGGSVPRQAEAPGQPRARWIKAEGHGEGEKGPAGWRGEGEGQLGQGLRRGSGERAGLSRRTQRKGPIVCAPEARAWAAGSAEKVAGLARQLPPEPPGGDVSAGERGARRRGGRSRPRHNATIVGP
ncbi:uncharacterized protein LOC115525129 [Lynx canadensis]|uniref:uncharacterized protein LOC115525129 n=1 Tax=Lynx canadensis TaxID=61383 RepID=UPI0013C4AD31|nr:uncharacterized protein LOC115525129 [Lynx canadensis]